MIMEFSDDIEKIEILLSQEHYDEVIDSSFKLVEKNLEYLYRDIFMNLKTEKAMEILEELKNNYNNKKFVDLTIGEKLRLFEKYKLFTYSKISLDKDFNPQILLKLNDLRCASTHPKKELDKIKSEYRKMTKGEAYFAYGTILRFLESLGCDFNKNDSIENNSQFKKVEETKEYNLIEKNVIANSIPRGDYVEFIGREDKINEIKELLLNDKVFVLSIDGIGGVGKSSLALEVVHSLLKDKLFDAIVWVSAKRDILTYDGIKPFESSLHNLEDLFDEILKIFNEHDFIKHGNIETKEGKVLELLKENHCLLVVDNLETIDDDRIKNFLIDIRFPKESKVLITSRKRLGQVERVVYLDKFSLTETDKYIRSQLNFKSYNGICSNELIEDIHSKTGGVPLAIKVVIPWIIEGKVKDKLTTDIDKETDILNFCFEKVFNDFLSEDDKKLFCVISLAPCEISEAALKFISGLKDEKFNQSLNSLINYSLIFIKEKEMYPDNPSAAKEEFICMLPLTQQFGRKVAGDLYIGLKEQINKDYMKFIKLTESEKYSAKRAMAINKAEDARRFFSEGNLEDAAASFKEALNYDKECDYALYLYAIFCKERQDFGQSKSLIEKALSLNNNNPSYWTEYATILEAGGNFKKAEQVLEEALVKTNNNRSVVMKLILIKSTKLEKNQDVLKIAKQNILYEFNEDKDKFLNTLLTVALLEAHWRIAYNYLDNKKIKESYDELICGINELNDLLEQNVIFPDNSKLLWQEKKIYKKLGDISYSYLFNKENAKNFYEKALYPIAYYEDRKSHNEQVKTKIRNLES